jgi:hypothetical protein
VFLSSLPRWVLAVLVIVAMIAGATINNRILAWCRLKYPWMFRPKTMVAMFAVSLVIIALGLVFNPPSKVWEEFQRIHPELFSAPVTPRE